MLGLAVAFSTIIRKTQFKKALGAQSRSIFDVRLQPRTLGVTPG